MVRSQQHTVNEIAMPVFRPDVRIEVGERDAVIAGPIRTARLGFEPEARDAMHRLLDHLRVGGRDPAGLVEVCPELGGQMDELLREFDDLRLLAESRPCQTPVCLGGTQLAHEIQRMLRRLLLDRGPGAFTRALRDRTATRAQIIGYVLEYGWFVAQATALIAPAIATAVLPQRRALLEEFFVGERGHDAFVRKALAAIGIAVPAPWHSRPLPSTFMIAASLSVYAKQHPPSFYAALSLFEAPQPEFMALFESGCMRLGLPEAFHRPLRAHAELNSREGHGDIGLALLSSFDAFGAEEEQLVRRHVGVLAETMLMQEDDIVRTYSDDAVVAQRLAGE